MIINNSKIELTNDENIAFIKQMKISVLHQLHKDKLLSSEQLNDALKLLNK